MWSYKHVRFDKVSCIPDNLDPQVESNLRKQYYCSKDNSFSDEQCSDIDSYGELQCLQSSKKEKLKIDSLRSDCKQLGVKSNPQFSGQIIKYCTKFKDFNACLNSAGGSHELIFKECKRFMGSEYELKCMELSKKRSTFEVETCNDFGNYNNFEECINRLPDRIIEPHIVKACDDFLYMNPRIECLNLMTGYSPAAVDLCKGFMGIDTKRNCIEGLPEKVIETHVSKACDDFRYLNDRLECVNFMAGRTSLEVDFCDDYIQLEAQRQCIDGLPNKKIELHVIDFCNDFSHLSSRAQCLSFSVGKTKDQLNNCKINNLSSRRICLEK